MNLDARGLQFVRYFVRLGLVHQSIWPGVTKTQAKRNTYYCIVHSSKCPSETSYENKYTIKLINSLLHISYLQLTTLRTRSSSRSTAQ